MYPDSLHAIVTCVGGAFPVDILSRGGDGALHPLPVSDVYRQLALAMSHARSSGQSHAPVICSLSALGRKSWAALREEIVARGGVAAASLGLMESAVVALSLEDCDAPPEMANILNTVRLGGGDGPCLRYYDKVTSGPMHPCTVSPVSLHIVLIRTNVINLLTRVPEHDRKDFFHAPQNAM